MLTAVVWMLGGLLALLLGGEALVRGATSAGRHFGLSPLVSGLTIVAFGTSSPELAVSLQSALAGLEGMAAANVVGSNVCNIALILGGTALIRPPTVEARLVRHDVPIMIGAAIALVLMLAGGAVSRAEGALLALALLAYLFFTVRAARAETRRIQQEFAEALPAAPHTLAISFLLVAGGLAVLVLGAHYFVDGAATLAELAGVPPAIVGLTLVAIGTSLPEIATTFVAAFRGQADMAVGNIVGSNIFNVLGIIGLSALVEPVTRGAITNLDLGVMLGVSLLLVPLMLTRARLDRWEGAVMLAVYCGYMYWLVP